LSGPESVGSALQTLTHDSGVVGKAIAVLGDAATVSSVAPT
jgi:hypothetical protein